MMNDSDNGCFKPLSWGWLISQTIVKQFFIVGQRTMARGELSTGEVPCLHLGEDIIEEGVHVEGVSLAASGV